MKLLVALPMSTIQILKDLFSLLLKPLLQLKGTKAIQPISIKCTLRTQEKKPTFYSMVYGVDKAKYTLTSFTTNFSQSPLINDYDHITPILASLRWLPVVFRIDFKILLLVFKSLNGLVPLYISDLLSPYTLPYTLRSANQLSVLLVPRARLVTEGARAFAVRAPQLWNALSLRVRQTITTGVLF